MYQEKQERIKIAILQKAIEWAPEIGWNEQLLSIASTEAGYSPNMGSLLFLDGVVGALTLLHQQLDQEMKDQAASVLPSNMKISERIYQLLALRFELGSAKKEAIVRGMHCLALPHNAATGLKIAWNTVDAMWNAAAAGDTDHNYYSKRTLLAGVYLSGQLYWSSDRSAGHAATLAFIRRRLADVAALGGVMKKVKEAI